MLQELACYHRGKNKKHYLFLNKPVYRIGKSLDNDIVLLNADSASKVIHLEKINGKYFWISAKGEVCAQTHSFHCGEYEFSVLNQRKRCIFVLFLFGLLASILCFDYFYQRTGSLIQTSIQLPARGTYGNLDPKKPSKAAEFEFRTVSNRYSVLHYTSGNIMQPQDLKIQVNGSLLGFVPVSPNKWSVEQSVTIPQGIIQKDSNKLVFEFQGEKQNAWAVKDIYIEEQEVAPVEQNGLALLQNAEKLFRERNVRRGNLIRAQQFAKGAGSFYHAKELPYPARLQTVMDKIQTEKTNMIDEYQLLMQKYQQQGNLKKARSVYRKLMNELIDPMDADRSRIIREFESLE